MKSAPLPVVAGQCEASTRSGTAGEVRPVAPKTIPAPAGAKEYKVNPTLPTMPSASDASRVLRAAMLDQDLSLKDTADRLNRSIGTVKRALNGSMGPRTAYRIVKVFGHAQQ